MKEKNNKTEQVSVRLNKDQSDFLDRLVQEKTMKNRSAAVQYIINQMLILGK